MTSVTVNSQQSEKSLTRNKNTINYSQISDEQPVSVNQVTGDK
jgi:hypothetical protein